MIEKHHRRSRIAEDRKESCFHIIANDRTADCSHTFRSAEMSNVLRVFCSQENQSKQHGGHRGGNFAATKFISSFSPKATTTSDSASKRKETSVLDSINIHEETRSIKSLADFFPTIRRSELRILWVHFDRRSQNFGFHMIAGSQTIHVLSSAMIEPCSIFCDHDRKRSQKCVSIWSQTIAELTFCDLRPRSSAIIWKPAFMPPNFLYYSWYDEVSEILK